MLGEWSENCDLVPTGLGRYAAGEIKEVGGRYSRCEILLPGSGHTQTLLRLCQTVGEDPLQSGLVAFVYQLNTSNGGVPKNPTAAGEINARGLVGDQQSDLAHHGSPDQALCLYSLQVIEQLQAEGHPIFPGASGENLTLSGLEWIELGPGKQLEVGDHVLIEITSFTSPCQKNAQWFVNGNFGRMSQVRHPGWSRLYAKVVHGGLVKTGDAVTAL
jgi:MOSC domain-containing protein YiiM